LLEKIGKPEKGRVLLAHGAGAGMDSDFMQAAQKGIADRGFEVIGFEFDYMQKRREDGKKRPPERLPKLQQQLLTAIEALPDDKPVWLAGKSMGGRVATTVVDQSKARGVLVFGYPFHPAGKQETLRIDHLQLGGKPVIICQGERDTMGSRELVESLTLDERVDIYWFADGNHDLKPRKASGFSHEQHMADAFMLAGKLINARES